MEALPEVVGQIVRGLRPIGLWYSSFTIIVGLVIWCFHGQGWAMWPPVFQFLVWTWSIITLIAPFYVHLVGYAVERQRKKLSESAAVARVDEQDTEELPVAPRPRASVPPQTA